MVLLVHGVLPKVEIPEAVVTATEHLQRRPFAPQINVRLWMEQLGRPPKLAEELSWALRGFPQHPKTPPRQVAMAVPERRAQRVSDVGKRPLVAPVAPALAMPVRV